MKKVKFTAEDVDFTSSNKIESVVLFNSEEERVLVFQHDPVNGADSHYIELDDQSFGTYNGVDEITLFNNKIYVKLNQEGKKALKCDEITVNFDLSNEKAEELRDSLSRFFKDEFKLDPSYTIQKKSKTKTSKTKVPKDYSKIEHLTLEDKKLSKLPDYVADMASLKEVVLYNNPNLDLDQAFKILGHLPIKEINIRQENLLIPSSIGNLRNLKRLTIRNLKLSQTIPTEIGNLKKLTYLGISTDPYTDAELTVPNEITQLTGLENLSVDARKWNLPDNIGNMKNLKSLSLSSCNLKQLPSDIVKLKNLKMLSLTNNPDLDWSDALRKISQLKKLSYLQISNTNIPAEIGLCRQIKTLRIFTGNNKNKPLILPDELENLTELVELNLGWNYLPQIPESISKLKSLKVLSFFDCSLQSIPESLGNLTQLTSLNLSSNPDSGDLPKSIQKMTSLKIHRTPAA
ncbi:MAG: Imm10 family immunity protein [Daejeonella sp.]